MKKKLRMSFIAGVCTWMALSNAMYQAIVGAYGFWFLLGVVGTIASVYLQYKYEENENV